MGMASDFLFHILGGEKTKVITGRKISVQRF